MSRSRDEVISTILQSVVTSASRMRIMYDSYLSYGQVGEYLAFLQKNELVTYDWETRHYTITAKGKSFLHVHKKVNELISSKEGSNKNNSSYDFGTRLLN
jgi:predicted transcriptional regulator